MTRDDQNIGSWLRHHACMDGNKSAIVFEQEAPLTYRQLSQWVDAAASELRDKFDVTKGDRIGYLGLNDPGMIVLLFACARLGAIFVPVNWRLAPAEAAYILSDCKPRVVFYTAELIETAKKSAEEIGAPAESSEKIHGWRRVEQQTATTYSSKMADRDTGRIDDPLLIVYTSGTTGRPKGAVLSQRAVFFTVF